MEKIIEEIVHDGIVYAIIVRSSYKKDGITFFTDNVFSQQLAYMHHPKGKQIEPHIHNLVLREVKYTQEVLVIKKGVVRVDFYNEQHGYLESRILRTGDVLFLASGGHGFEALEDLEMFEIKQGPYVQERDKTRFSRPENVNLKIVD